MDSSLPSISGPSYKFLLLRKCHFTFFTSYPQLYLGDLTGNRSELNQCVHVTESLAQSYQHPVLTIIPNIYILVSILLNFGSDLQLSLYSSSSSNQLAYTKNITFFLKLVFMLIYLKLEKLAFVLLVSTGINKYRQGLNLYGHLIQIQ